MARFVKFKTWYESDMEKDVYVNPDHVALVESNPDYTIIHFSSSQIPSVQVVGEHWAIIYDLIHVGREEEWSSGSSKTGKTGPEHTGAESCAVIG